LRERILPHGNVLTTYNNRVTSSCTHFVDITDKLSARKIARTEFSAKLHPQPPNIALLSPFE